MEIQIFSSNLIIIEMKLDDMQTLICEHHDWTNFNES